MTIYAATSAKVLAKLGEKGATVTFPGAIGASPPVFDPTTGTFSAGTPGTDGVGKAIQLEDDPAARASKGLVLQNPLTLMLAASGLGFTPVADMLMVWADGKTYAVKSAEPFAPDGVPIYWTIIGAA